MASLDEILRQHQGGRPKRTIEDYAARYLSEEEPEKEDGFWRETGNVISKVASGIPRAASSLVGLASLVPGLHYAADPLARGLGKTAEWMDEKLLSDDQKRQDAEMGRVMESGEGFMDSAGKMGSYLWENPSQILTTAAGSVPSIFAGGLVAKGLKAGLGARAGNTVTRATTGEGAVIAGAVASDIAEQNPDEFAKRYYAIPAGVGGAAFGRLGAKVAGPSDIDVMIARGLSRTDDMTLRTQMDLLKPMYKRVATGLASESLLEEGPQSLLEGAMTNLGTNKPWDDNLGGQTVLGAAAGGLLGGGAAVMRPGNTYTKAERDSAFAAYSDPSTSTEDRAKAKQYLQRVQEADRVSEEQFAQEDQRQADLMAESVSNAQQEQTLREEESEQKDQLAISRLLF